jgi:hypothetical protein
VPSYQYSIKTFAVFLRDFSSPKFRRVFVWHRGITKQERSSNRGIHAQVRFSFHCHQQQALRVCLATASFTLSYLPLSIRRSLRSPQPCSQQSKEADWRLQVSVSQLPAPSAAFHAQAVVGAYPSRATFSFILSSRCAPSAAVTRG